MPFFSPKLKISRLAKEAGITDERILPAKRRRFLSGSSAKSRGRSAAKSLSHFSLPFNSEYGEDSPALRLPPNRRKHPVSILKGSPNQGVWRRGWESNPRI